MKKSVLGTLCFVIGAVVGSVITNEVVKYKYEEKANTEIDIIRDFYEERDQKRRETDGPRVNEDKNRPVDEPETYSRDVVTEYNKYVKLYSTPEPENDTIRPITSAEAAEKRKEAEDVLPRPYVINPDDYGFFSDYETVSLHYYEDGVVANDEDDVFDDYLINGTIGFEAIRYLEDNEDEEAVYVRNEELKYDYEVIREPDRFADVRPDLV